MSETNTTTYVVLRHVRHDHVHYDCGDTIELDEATAARLLGSEAIAPVVDTATSRDQVLDRALASLDPDNAELWTQNGLPQVAALEAAAGFDVTAAERDVAWVRHQQARATGDA